MSVTTLLHLVPPRTPPCSMERSLTILAIRDALRLLVHHDSPDAMAFACIETAIEYVAGGDFEAAREALAEVPGSRGWR